MATSTTQKKERILKKLVKKLDKKGFDEIKAKLSGFTTPSELSYNGSLKKFVPDMVTYKDEVMDFYEFENKVRERDVQDQVAKWILFGSHAKQNRGKFYLMVPIENSDRFENLIEKMQLDVELVKLEK